MAQIRIDLAETLLDGMDIKFKAPCSCSGITGLAVYYPKEDGATGFKELVFRDAHGNDLTGIGNLFDKDSYVKVIVDANNGYAYLQNAATNGYLNTAILGTYTHDAENLIGSGENGKFKATVSGTISTINVNGVACSVKCGEESSMDLIAGCWYTFILDGNTVNFNSGGAGAGLNFKVVGGTTEPASPSENMIWVNTDAEITSWVFSATQPEAAEGKVWFFTGTRSAAEFNALRKNGIQICPLSAKQYVSGAWVAKTAKSYQNGAWRDWVTFLIQQGADNTAVTGGWKAQAKALSGHEAYAPTVTNNGDHLTLTLPKGSKWRGGIYIANNKLDLTDIKTITVVGSGTSGSNSSARGFGIWSSIGSYMFDNNPAKVTMEAFGEWSLDVSEFTGEYIIGFYMASGGVETIDAYDMYYSL